MKKSAEMNKQEMLDVIDWFIDHEISLDDIEEELDYRDRAAEGMRWNDSLYGYSDEDLLDIAFLWVELNKGEQGGETRLVLGGIEKLAPRYHRKTAVCYDVQSRGRKNCGIN